MNKKLVFLCTSMVILMAVLSACSAAAATTKGPVPPPSPQTFSKSAPMTSGSSDNAVPLPAAPVTAPVAPGAPVPAGGSGTSAAEVKRIVIKNATLSLAVKDPQASMDRIGKMAESMGGFIVNTSVGKTTSPTEINLPQAFISIRVPAAQLTDAIARIKSEVGDPVNDILVDSVTGSDVTKDYTDLQSRLTNQQNAADQLKIIMAKTDKTEDVMSVYTQLMQVNEQIEILKGQIKYYDEASSMSEISVTLQSIKVIAPIEVAGWKPEGVARDAVQALINTFQALGTFGIWFVILVLPILIIFVLLIFLLFIILRAIIRAYNRSKKPKAPPVQEK